MEEGPGLADGEVIMAFRTRGIFKNYRFREEAMRRAASVDFVSHTESDLEEKSFRGNSSTYRRSINSIWQHEFNEQPISTCGAEDTYDRTRMMPHRDGYNVGNRRYDSERTFQRRNRQNQ